MFAEVSGLVLRIGGLKGMKLRIRLPIVGIQSHIKSYDHLYVNIGIKHGFSCINIRQVPREVLKTEAGGRGFQHHPRDLANVNALKIHVRSLLLHKN